MKPSFRLFWILVLIALSILACSTNPGKPTIIIVAPPHGSEFREGDSVTVQSVATDPAEIVRVELMVDGAIVRSDAPPTAGIPVFSAAQAWRAAPGSHTLSVRALNRAGTASDPAAITISVLPQITTATATPLPPSLSTTTPTPLPTPVVCTNKASFVADVTVPPGTALAPGQTFNKIWRIRNDGTCAWDQYYQFVFIAGEAMTKTPVLSPPNTAPGATTDVLLPMAAPTALGVHAGQWQMRASNGALFGDVVRVEIKVVSLLPAGCSGEPTIEYFTANPLSITAGQTVILVWGKVDNATSATIDQGIGGVGTPSSTQVTPTQTTTYTLVATGCSGVTTKRVTVTVNP